MDTPDKTNAQIRVWNRYYRPFGAYGVCVLAEHPYGLIREMWQSAQSAVGSVEMRAQRRFLCFRGEALAALELASRNGIMN